MNLYNKTAIFPDVLRYALLPMFGALLLVACTASAQAPTDTSENLVGIWGCERYSGLLAHGELTIDGRGAGWRATISGFDVPVKHENGDVTFSLPEGEGEFRGHLSADSQSVYGDWIQPARDYFNNPYATPVKLSSQGKSVWRGTVMPLDEKFSFYVSIQREPDQSLTAFFNNPEMNFYRHHSFKVTREGTAVHVSNDGGQIDGTFDAQNDILSLRVVDSMPPFQFTRRKGKDAIGFFPRVLPEGEKYVYREPIAEDDGWQTASLDDAGLDQHLISALVDRILGVNLADNPINIQSLLIARHGKLVLEEYFYGFSKERTHDMRSAAKTFAPVLVGIAHDHGTKIGPESPVYSFFPQYKEFANWSERKKRVTVRDIMTMTAGNACDDNDGSSPGNENNMQGQNQQADWYKFTLDLPMVNEPGGEHAIYCSADLNLVGGVVANATGKWLPEFFDEYLARPLQFGNYHLNLTPTGEAYTGGGAYLRPRDELKLGQLYLAGGTWNGRRVVSKEWVADSIAHHSSFTPALKEEGEHQYGYGWHMHSVKAGDRVFRDYNAGGNGGQLVIVIPELDLVVGINGGSYGEFDKWYRWEFELVPQYIIPAAISAQTH
jgi:CubicO group peptidase (beta-lactamase class C family)